MGVILLLLILKWGNGISRSVRAAQVRARAREVAFDACVAARAEHAALRAIQSSAESQPKPQREPIPILPTRRWQEINSL